MASPPPPPMGPGRPSPRERRPVVLPARVIAERHALAHTLASAGFRMAQAIALGPSRELILGALSPLERGLIERSAPATRRLAIARIDFLVSTRPAALEINATIPAMQGYSDIAAGASPLLEVVARHVATPRGRDPRCSTNGSNAWRSTAPCWTGTPPRRKGRPPDAIALLCRRNDAQIPSCATWPSASASSARTRTRAPGRGVRRRRLHRERQAYDWSTGTSSCGGWRRRPRRGWRTSWGAPGKKAVFLNPPTSQMEVKTTFALLSQALASRSWPRARG